MQLIDGQVRYTVPELADRYGMDGQTIRKGIASGELAAIKLGKYLVSQTDWDNWIAFRATKPHGLCKKAKGLGWEHNGNNTHEARMDNGVVFLVEPNNTPATGYYLSLRLPDGVQLGSHSAFSTVDSAKAFAEGIAKSCLLNAN